MIDNNSKILIANRGEIAIRIITAASELGFQTVAVYSDEQDKSHCFGANQAIKLKSAASFLDPHQIIHAAESVNATAIHPGYGFLSESSDLANLCETTNILFIGPSVSCISALGDKVSARQVAKASGVPVIPGTEESIFSADQVYTFASQVGYPVMLKARDGGGGRGIRMVHHEKEVVDALARCINESPSKQVFVEKAVIGAKHIEVQVLGDSYGNVIHLFERDCSVQRRYQKILEVAPCPCLSDQLRSSIHQAALKLARHIQYNSAGTIEFLVKPDSNEFYFLEVNPRIQVEHTISEQITHVDIVQAQIKVAFGENLKHLGLVQESITPSRLMSIQARIVAENPLNNNALSVGKITHVQLPQGHGVRVDTWIESGCVVLPTFDSLLAKVIVTGQSYNDALAKLKRALENTMIQGVDTNIQFLIAMISNKSFVGDNLSHVTIKSLEEKMDTLIEATRQLSSRQHKSRSTVEVVRSSSAVQFKPGDAFNIETSNTTYSFQIDSISTNNFPDQFIGQITTSLEKKPLAISVTRKSAGTTLRRKARVALNDIGSPVTGMIVEINVKNGDRVEAGQQLFVMNAMKMETVVKASVDGVVKTVYASVNELVEGGDMVIELLPPSSDSKL